MMSVAPRLFCSLSKSSRARHWALRLLLACAVVSTGHSPLQAQRPNATPPGHPFQVRFPAGEFPADGQWINSRPLRLANLKGKFVLLDFWTYCCINCMHILPELKTLEQEFSQQLVVVGVHSAKFEAEKDTDNISAAILRYDIEHPVINDPTHVLWNRIGVNSWPTIVLIDPEGYAVWGRPGEFKAEEVAAVLKKALPYYRQRKTLDETPVKFELLRERLAPRPLSYPGKVLADPQGGRLFVADSNHNRIVVASLEGVVQAVIGSGQEGAADGDYASATFNDPQGMALHGESLYVADNENHRLRKVDLQSRQVTTVAGTGEQARVPGRRAGPPRSADLSSPWALWIHGNDLYVAMAGCHQIWRMSLDEREIGAYAGDGHEDIVDGPLLPRGAGGEASSFAQPSGLTGDGQWLYVADSEGSSIRAVPFDTRQPVRTVVGTSHLPQARLFTFGDHDGPKRSALLQHCIGVAYADGRIYVADTYNNKVKVVDAKSGEVRTIAGDGTPGLSDSPARFDEPAGLSIAGDLLYVADTNNHAIRVVQISTGAVRTLALQGLQPPKPPAPKKPSFADATKVAVPELTVAPVDGKLLVTMQLTFPEGWKLNDLAPWSCWAECQGDQGPISREALGKIVFPKDNLKLEFSLPVTGAGQETLVVSLPYYYCSEGGLCKVGSVVWTVPLKLDPAAATKQVGLEFKVE